MTFKEWWSTEGVRMANESGEELIAQAAWDASFIESLYIERLSVAKTALTGSSILLQPASEIVDRALAIADELIRKAGTP